MSNLTKSQSEEFEWRRYLVSQDAVSPPPDALLLLTGFWPNSHSWRQIGQEFLLLGCVNHLLAHCKWKAWAHFPHTTGQSSPGYLTPGAVPSKANWQIPQTSSLAFQLQWATPWSRRIRTLRRRRGLSASVSVMSLVSLGRFMMFVRSIAKYVWWSGRDSEISLCQTLDRCLLNNLLI